jgi:hypothetical protein
MDKVRLLIEGDEYWVEGGDFDDLLDAVKLIAGRRFDRDERAWVVPGPPERVAAAVSPYRLMFFDDDPLADSRPIEVEP